ncbi:5-formyltetrahydrofolate cyclo-ligase [Bacillus pakistanensis]|uniref:5-formyltetrahydrofolate cyclo-ligase n=1 Tax=Rossellomorea pakistanensis TaxID=992288 RepID=A0ABS2N9Z3_9BACI|nr:5-formyltetrahydrofolate cyclo-ligase [Bacillus pakistanensis]MBM7584673.1 5-formyltetrahydrofolate cyclo-ligase [Bacillus pakistanensis]
MNKKQFREAQIKLMSSMSKQEYEQKSYEITRRLFASNQWKKSNVISLTISNFPEVHTWDIVKRGWEENKQIAVPKCISSDKTMDFRTITSFTQLEKVYFGLLEPIPSKTVSVTSDEMDLVIVPGLAFTRHGYRLGFGGGYYDRFLENYRGSTVSLAFKEQVVESIPIESFDLPVQSILSEAEDISCE